MQEKVFDIRNTVSVNDNSICYIENYVKYLDID